MRACGKVRKMANEERERGQGPHLFQHVRVDEDIVAGARARYGVERIFHRSFDAAGIDPLALAEEGKGNEANSAARQIDAVPGTDAGEVDLPVHEVGDVEPG